MAKYIIKPSKIIYKNGIIYEGEYDDIYPHGKGVLYLDDNCIIRGTFDLTQTNLEYEFEIPKLTKFHQKLQIDKKNFKFKNINSEYAKNMIFHIGMIELISYWKSTCSPKVIIKCGYLNEEQIKIFINLNG